jgi:hypothetical protein
MVVEASVHNTPVVSLVIDSPTGWQEKFTLPLSRISGWPTHLRFRVSKAGREATNETELLKALNHFLRYPTSETIARQSFLTQECTYLDGRAGLI